MTGFEIDEALLLDWTTAIEALDFDTIQELYELQPQLLWTALQPVHLESDFAHFIQRLESFRVLGTSLRPVYPLHHILFDYGVPGDEWASDRSVLVDFILKNTTGNELNSCLWGAEENTTMHLAYLLNQPNLTQQLIEKGALANTPNKLGHLPMKEEQLEKNNDDQPKLLINKSKPTSKEKVPVSTSDRFRRLRELAESPNNKGNKTTTGRQNSTRRYFRPGHLEEKKRRILNEEEEELEKQKLKRQKDIELLAQRSAVKNNPLFKKLEGQNQKVEQKPAGPSVSTIRDRQKLLKGDEQIKRSSRVINSLKNSSYVSSSVFRQTQPSEDKNTNAPPLAKLRLASKESVVDSKEENSNATSSQKLQTDKDSIIDEDVSDNASTKSKKSALSLKVNNENNKSSTSLSLSSPTASLKSNSTSLFSPSESSFALKNTTSTSLSLKSPTNASFDNTNLSDLGSAVTDEELDLLNIGKMRELNVPTKSAQEKKLVDIGPVNIKNIVDMHEQHNVKEEIEIHTIGRKFEVWKKDARTVEELEDDSIISRKKDTDASSLEKQPLENLPLEKQSLEKQPLENNHSTVNCEAISSKIDIQTTDQKSVTETDTKSLASIQTETSSVADIDTASIKSRSEESVVLEQDVTHDASMSDRPEAVKKKPDVVDQTQFKKDLKLLEKRAENTTTKIEMHERAIEASVKHKPTKPKKLKSLKLGPEALNQKRALFNQRMAAEPMPTRRFEESNASAISEESDEDEDEDDDDEDDDDDEYSQPGDIIRSTSSSTSTASSYSKSASTPVVIDNSFGDAQIADDHTTHHFQALHQNETVKLFETHTDSNNNSKTVQYIPISQIEPLRTLDSISQSETIHVDSNSNTENLPTDIPTNENNRSRDIPRDNVTEAKAKRESFEPLSINTSASADVATHIEEEEDAVTPTLASVNALHDETTAATEPAALHEAPELDDSKSNDLDLNYEHFIKQQERGVDLESEVDTAYSSNELLDTYHNQQPPAHENKPMVASADKTNEDSHISEASHIRHDQQSMPLHRISAISEATTSSDQWFDPDDSWVEQQRKSALLAGFGAHASQDISRNDQHRDSDLSSIVSDEYYYKRSSSTDHTGLDDDLDNDSYSHMDSEKLNSTQLKKEEATAIQPFTHEDTYVQSSAYENISVQPTTYENINTKSAAYENIDVKSSAYENKNTQSFTRVDTEVQAPVRVHTDTQISTREIADAQSSTLKNIGIQSSLQEDKDLHSTTQESASPKPPVKIFTSADVFDEDDYYSTQLHTEAASYSQKTTMTGSIASSGTQMPAVEERVKSRVYLGNQEEEGEITVFMDPSDQQSVKSSPISSTDHNHLGVFHQPNVSTASLVSQRGQYLAVKQEDDSSPPAMIQVPSRTVPIIDHKTEQEYVPHDPNNPRVEDISHYMNTLPTLNKNNHEITGSSAFDTSASFNSNEESMTKHAISMTPSARPVVLEDSRGIPNAHEMDFKPIPEECLSSSEESKVSFEVSQYGKMYIGVSGAHSVLLPLPKEITYVRCVISDGEFEYVSRYEILGPQILMDYECCVDVRPGTIITVSLLVRPDFHVKPKTGWGRLFTSIRKQKEHLSGYVHPEDGAIGQTRFAVDHMVSGCYKKTYEAYFDCFNSWYARTNRERARREQYGDDEDFLKIIGKMNIEMLYLPVSSPHVRVPKSLRECDLTLKIRQWHDTCWQSGYLSTRCQGKKIWERHFYRLIGSQLIGHEQATDNIWDHYNIADVIRLSAAADKVIVTLVEDDDSKVFGDKTIHDYGQKGFFRLQFPNYYLDCVSDSLEESEEWVKTLKSMIGRVPLKLPFMEE